MSNIQIDEVNRMIAEGKPFRTIAKHYKLPLGTFYSRIKAMGFKTDKKLVPIHPKQEVVNGHK